MTSFKIGDTVRIKIGMLGYTSNKYGGQLAEITSIVKAFEKPYLGILIKGGSHRSLIAPEKVELVEYFTEDDYDWV